MKRILLVDDEADTLRTYSDLLSSEGYEVATASSGDEATGMIDGYRPDLILLDVMMPGKSGLEVARELSGRRETQDIPIVMITALSSVPSPHGNESIPGVRRFIYKPCRPRTLLEGVDHVLRYGR
ncbi:MAG TPA: response regulator [Planctomycetota bacterium]|nr:response regulator [Planctomycetota bacterium]